jgi:hypothetical protein
MVKVLLKSRNVLINRYGGSTQLAGRDACIARVSYKLQAEYRASHINYTAYRQNEVLFDAGALFLQDHGLVSNLWMAAPYIHHHIHCNPLWLPPFLPSLRLNA